MKLKTSETGQVMGFQLCFVVHDMYSRFVIRELMKFTSLLFTNSGIVDFHVPIIAASTVFFLNPFDVWPSTMDSFLFHNQAMASPWM